MPPPYREPHFGELRITQFIQQGVFGRAPAAWVETMGIQDVPDQDALPRERLTRHRVREICRDEQKHVLYGYACAMAWGLQGIGRTIRYAQEAWNMHRHDLEEKLERLRNNNLTRQEAYRLFIDENAIHGLGPAYFTKLLYFFSPNEIHYIMDQWVAKSIDLLTGEWVVRIYGDAVSPYNQPGNYQAYCEEIDYLADHLNCNGAEMEERLFSRGGRNPGHWRQYVREQWEGKKPSHRYSRRRLSEIYAHIQATNF